MVGLFTYLQVLFQGMMAARNDPEKLAPGDLYFLFDAGHAHFGGQMLKCMVNAKGEPLDKEVFKVHLTTDEDSKRMEARCTI